MRATEKGSSYIGRLPGRDPRRRGKVLCEDKSAIVVTDIEMPSTKAAAKEFRELTCRTEIEERGEKNRRKKRRSCGLILGNLTKYEQD